MYSPTLPIEVANDASRECFNWFVPSCRPLVCAQNFSPTNHPKTGTIKHSKVSSYTDVSQFHCEWYFWGVIWLISSKWGSCLPSPSCLSEVTSQVWETKLFNDFALVNMSQECNDYKIPRVQEVSVQISLPSLLPTQLYKFYFMLFNWFLGVI